MLPRTQAFNGIFGRAQKTEGEKDKERATMLHCAFKISVKSGCVTDQGCTAQLIHRNLFVHPNAGVLIKYSTLYNTYVNCEYNCRVICVNKEYKILNKTESNSCFPAQKFLSN